MQDNTKVNLSIADKHQPASMQMNRHFYLIPRDKKFLSSFQFTFRSTNIPTSLPADCSLNNDSINENKRTQYKNNTFEDKTRNNDQYA